MSIQEISVVSLLLSLASGGPAYAAVGLPNPAAAYCVESGGQYQTEDRATGARSVCRFPDGRVVDAWEFFRKNSPKPASPKASSAQRIWLGGPILTMNDAAMRAEAIAEADGKILAVGSRADVMKLKGPKKRWLHFFGQISIRDKWFGLSG